METKHDGVKKRTVVEELSENYHITMEEAESLYQFLDGEIEEITEVKELK